jgi:hypothetical protein
MCCLKSLTEQEKMKQETIISDSASIKELIPEISLFKAARKNIRLQIENLSEQENKKLQYKVEKYYKACGCSQGRITGIITLFVFILFMLTGIVPVQKLGIAKTFLYYFIFSFITMLIGKTAALYQARRQLGKLADTLENNIPITA